MFTVDRARQGDPAMSHFTRLILAVAIVIVYWAVFFLPLSAMFMAYVITTNPPWVRDFLTRLDAGPSDNA
jgi:hypothetical protein